MANRGKPLPFALREQIQQRRQCEPVRKVAQALSISKTTVQKYGRKFGTN